VTRQESRVAALALPGQLGTSEGVLVDLVGPVGPGARLPLIIDYGLSHSRNGCWVSGDRSAFLAVVPPRRHGANTQGASDPTRLGRAPRCARVINLSAATLQSSCHNGYLAPRRRSRLPFDHTTAPSSHRRRQATERLTAERRSARSKSPSNFSLSYSITTQRYF
jgi:hypothetical protein